MDFEPEVSGSLSFNTIKDKWIIGINKNHHPNRQRFTMAHEFAHFCLHKTTISDFEDGAFFRNSTVKNQIEREANEFAAELLMPKEEIEKIIKNGEKKLNNLADTFGVSVLAMRYRVIQIGYKLKDNEK